MEGIVAGKRWHTIRYVLMAKVEVIIMIIISFPIYLNVVNIIFGENHIKGKNVGAVGIKTPRKPSKY